MAVLTIADILPALEFATSHDLFFIKQDDASSVDVALDLSIAGFELFDMLDLCVEVSRPGHSTHVILFLMYCSRYYLYLNHWNCCR